MNVLMLLIDLPFGNGNSNLYLDLAKEFYKNNHNIFVIAPCINNQYEGLFVEDNINVLRVKTFKQKNIKSVLKKGIAQILLPYQFKRSYHKFLSGVHFDLILMPTPPITLITLARHIKLKNNCILYLILRDIYPQGAADLDLIKFRFIYKYLKIKERITYEHSDIIGCMSNGNIEYIKKHNVLNEHNKLTLLPNWQSLNTNFHNNIDIRIKYNLNNKYIVLFGGTIGYAQKVENIIFLANNYKDNPDVIFVVIGNGVKKDFLVDSAKKDKLTNILFFDSLPREQYLDFIKSADIGLITIDDRFTVPTIPSKLTSYFALKLPVLAIIDKHTDFGSIIDESGGGLWSIGENKISIINNFNKLYKDKNLRAKMGENGFRYFNTYLTSELAYRNIIKHINKDE